MSETNPTAVPPPATDSWAAIEAAVLLVIANDLVDGDVPRAAVDLVSIAERIKRLAGAVPDTGPPPLDFDVLVRSIVDSRYMWISMENAVDMAVTTARLLVAAGAVRIVADGQPVELHGSLGAMRRLVHSRGITADERDHDVAVSRPVPPLEGRERDRLCEVLDAAGLPRDRDWDDVLLALRSMGARAVPDTGQARYQETACARRPAEERPDA